MAGASGAIRWSQCSSTTGSDVRHTPNILVPCVLVAVTLGAAPSHAAGRGVRADVSGSQGSAVGPTGIIRGLLDVRSVARPT